MADLQGAIPVIGVTPAVALVDGLNGVSLMVLEGERSMRPLPRLPEAETLDPEPTGIRGRGNFVPRGLSGAELVAWVADVLQEGLAETQGGWGQARPPCPHHPHPVRPVVRDGQAWWVCERLGEPLYRIGAGEVPSQRPTPSWEPRTRPAGKRRHQR